MERVWRLYLDTSVFGGVFDAKEGFDTHSRRVIEIIRSGRARLLYSPALPEELAGAPSHVRKVFEDLRAEHGNLVAITNEVQTLSQAYLDAGIVGPKWIDDTLHIAAATVAGADAIVSWNFKHMVRLDYIKEYNRVNVERGYAPLLILSPMEVVFNE